jgi:hypothetical protein
MLIEYTHKTLEIIGKVGCFYCFSKWFYIHSTGFSCECRMVPDLQYKGSLFQQNHVHVGNSSLQMPKDREGRV